MKEKNVNASIRMPESYLKRIDEIAEKNERDRSEILRIAVKKYLDVVDKVYAGESLLFLPKLDELKDYQNSITELEILLNSNVSESTQFIIQNVIDTLEFKMLDELKKKHPNYKGFFNLSNIEKNI